MGQRGLGLIPKQRVKEGINLVLEMLVCITHRITASPGEAQRDGPSLPASISLSVPAGHLQGQKPSFPSYFFFFPLTQSLGSFPCQSIEIAGMMHRLRSVRPDTSVIVTGVWMKLPPARDAVIFPLYYRFCTLSPGISWNFPQRNCLLSVLFLDTPQALQKYLLFLNILQVQVH